ncbi:MAG: alpha/beta hydrolase [Cycloclasticus sp. symbiont of Poecilosclerida sp. N]|nr:MAG: alpha/beta hydrolase [Cycloclasticus sp. symbiont of Poecilosclerida sp. N]
MTKPFKLTGFKYSKVTTQGAEINVAAAGIGPPLLLLHGYPQTHLMWHKIAPNLSENFHVICPDLRGYGDSSKPPSEPSHSPYSKREMAKDMIDVMQQMGHDCFYVAGHDRGARVTHRMALDHPKKILKAAVLDIIPTYQIFKQVDQIIATSYYHWFFLIQDNNVPEHLIGADPDFYLKDKLKRWSVYFDNFDPDIVNDYLRCFRQIDTIHASCEDYRAAASIDLEHDKADLNNKIECPLLVLWGKHAIMGKHFDMLDIWRNKASAVSGKGLDSGHFLAEEAPKETLENLLAFFKT